MKLEQSVPGAHQRQLEEWGGSGGGVLHNKRCSDLCILLRRDVVPQSSQHTPTQDGGDNRLSVSRGDE